MKSKIIIYLTMLISLILAAQGDLITWSRTFDGICHQEDVAYDVELTSDGGYVVAGVKWDQAPFSPDWIFPHMWILKLDVNGDTLWTTTYYHNIEISDPLCNDYYYKYAEAYDIEQTSDGGYIVCGYVEIELPDSTPNYRDAMCILKLDKYGDIEWNKSHYEEQINVANSIKQTQDGGYIVAGEIKSIDSSSKRMGKLLKLDAHGDTLWTKNYSREDSLPMWFDKLCLSSDSSFAVTGSNTIMFKNNGEVVWNKQHILGERYYDIKKTTDDNFIVVGYAYIEMMSAFGISLINYNSNGDTLWTRTISSGEYNLSSHAYSISQTIDSGFIIAGKISDMRILKTDMSGNIEWDKIYANSGISCAYSIGQTEDNGYIVCGQTEGSASSDNSSDWTDMWVLKLDQDGNYTGIENHDELLVKDYNLYQNYPNPFNSVTTIQYMLQNTCDVEIVIFNSKGEFVENLVKERQSKGKQSVIFNSNNLNSGVYYYRLNIEGITKETKKMLYLK